MTAHKDFKKLVRSRMTRTGESYTSARASLLKRSTSLLPEGYEKIAGLSDKVLKEKTGCTWERWFKALDKQKAFEWDHTRIATFINEKYKVDGWWAQMITVGYERLKGLRARGQRRGGTWGADKSKTINAPIKAVFDAFTVGRRRSQWLPGVVLRTSQPGKSARLGMPDGTIAAILLTAKGPGKTAVAVGQDNLPSKSASDGKKAFWAGRLAALAELLA